MKNEITLDHIAAACRWAKKAIAEPLAIDGLERKYDQSSWDCGTSCCIWGAASIASGNGPAKSGPPPEWVAQSGSHLLAAALMNSGSSTPEQIEAVLQADLQGADLQDADLQGVDLRGADLRGVDLRGADLRDADLRDADLRDADLQGADLRDANLQGANLQGANLQGANLRGAIIWLGNRKVFLS